MTTVNKKILATGIGCICGGFVAYNLLKQTKENRKMDKDISKELDSLSDFDDFDSEEVETENKEEVFSTTLDDDKVKVTVTSDDMIKVEDTESDNQKEIRALKAEFTRLNKLLKNIDLDLIKENLLTIYNNANLGAMNISSSSFVRYAFDGEYRNMSSILNRKQRRYLDRFEYAQVFSQLLGNIDAYNGINTQMAIILNKINALEEN